MAAKQIALGLGIAIFFVLLVGLSIDFLYEAPNYRDFCDEERGIYPEPIDRTNVVCNVNYSDYQEMFDNCNKIKGMIIYDYDDSECRVPVSCSTCNLEYNDARDRYDRNFFFITIIIAATAIVSGILLSAEFLSIGFIFGGIFTALYGIGRYFSSMSKLVRLITVLAILVMLIIVGKKKLVKEGKNGKKQEKRKKR